MNVVWPVTGLFATVFAVWAYYRYGRLATHDKIMTAKDRDEQPSNKARPPFPMMMMKGTYHCGSGCALGDICAEFLGLGFPVLAVLTGWTWLFPDSPMSKIFAVWVLDFIFAFGFGVVFQYFTIKPMRDPSPWQGLVQAVKADTLSLTACRWTKRMTLDRHMPRPYCNDMNKA